MHVNDDGSSSFVGSNKRLISWKDITCLSVRKFLTLSIYILYLTFFSGTDLLRAGSR